MGATDIQSALWLVNNFRSTAGPLRALFFRGRVVFNLQGFLL